ncbi:haloacid dehalogenase superfamily, subfamily IA, variant 3 with third motif having DD or ED/haloacid dehalogenase superfamily, subfamily IA, variant 1 with third motif having Dx(3-4)D or Dx(3-4)E [Bosea sp. OK403]|uniref:HAD family hydrolase n=1 Tax=Bosea sp. OK403 TaxID=1855286 RepID=UPI0008F35F8E|nr:HAD family phosphatase [Bosea sp. OK403]SFI70658.1 haloacid dehalogenase superfamily, subfamily IA, variant 3 with third motif having DD or ED/haloacid dehalogenase superfamily, subfamily IA, variant 1 with third motif having Dx(3-4)D or Dx(3-4)E [Bosea sp. OK403]
MAALIFDFDGVVADSESLANLVLAEAVSALGHPTTLDDALTRYCGRRWSDVVIAIEGDLGAELPPDFSDALKAATLARFRSDLREVEGASAFIARFHAIPRCIASSSSIERLTLCLDVLGLASQFGQNVFSAEMVARGKPHPDIFLLAASKLGTNPESCLVIEDSTGGIKAAAAAGMESIGLCAASHIRAAHAERLRAAGATHIATSWQEVDTLATEFLQRQQAMA